MKKLKYPILAASIVLSSLSISTIASADEPTIPSSSGILFNPNTEEILFEKDADKIISPASLTKVMTLLIVSEEIKKNNIDTKNTTTIISEKAWKTKGSLMFLNIGAEVPINDLINGLAIVSGNDAAVALAEHFYGSTDTFVKKMNERAKELGMKNTKFATVNGLSDNKDGDKSTARDLMILTDYYMDNFPENMEIHGTKEFTTLAKYHGGKQNIVQQSRNPLLGSYKGGTGLKTGMIENTYNLIGTAERDNIELIGVVLGAKSNNDRSASIFNLLDYGFNQYETVNQGKKDEALNTLKVYKAKGTKKTEIYLKDDIDIVVNKKDIESIEVKDNYPKFLEGGFKENEKIGERIVKIKDKEYKFDIIVKNEIKEASWFIKFLDEIAILFNKLVDWL